MDTCPRFKALEFYDVSVYFIILKTAIGICELVHVTINAQIQGGFNSKPINLAGLISTNLQFA